MVPAFFTSLASADSKLTAEAMMSTELEWSAVIITLVSDVVYTGIAVWGLTRMFNSEKVMFAR